MDTSRSMEVSLEISVPPSPMDGKEGERSCRDPLSMSASTVAPSPLAQSLYSPVASEAASDTSDHVARALFADTVGNEVALDQEPAPVPAPVPAFVDTVCSVCLCRLADNEVAIDQGLGTLPFGENVHVVICMTCHASGKSFDRSPDDDKPRFSERRSHFEAEKDRLQQQVARQKQAAEEAMAEKERREKEHRAEKERMEAELRELRQGLTTAAQHMPEEQRQSWMQWLLRRQPQ